MKRKQPLWLFLICIGAVPCSAVYLYGLHGMVFGSAFSTFPGINPTYDFTCNLLSVFSLFFPLIAVFYLIMIFGMISATLEIYQEDRNSKRILCLVISLMPSIGSLIAGMITSIFCGVMIEEISPQFLTGLSAILPWTTHYIAQFWYLHLIPVVIYPFSIRRI